MKKQGLTGKGLNIFESKNERISQPEVRYEFTGVNDIQDNRTARVYMAGKHLAKVFNESIPPNIDGSFTLKCVINVRGDGVYMNDISLKKLMVQE